MPVEIDHASLLLAAIIDSSDDAIVSKTLDGIITSWNRAAERMFGYSADEAIGRHIMLIVPPERQAEEQEVLARLRRGEKVEHFETIRRAKDGRILNVSLTVSPIKNSEGRIIGASKVGRDITEKKQWEREREEHVKSLEAEIRERKKAQAALMDAVRARDDFVAVAAHELRRPVNVISLSSQLLEREAARLEGSSSIRKAAERARRQVDRLAKLIDRLLDVSRIRVGTFELNPQPFDVSALVREVAARFVGEAVDAPILLDLPPSIPGIWDQLRIDQVLTNLIDNAIRYGGESQVRITAHSRADDVAIAVHDKGPGIAPGDLPKIFDRFERGGARNPASGLGLGLWISRHIARAHGGDVVAESVPGQGSTFTLTLPKKAASKSAPA